MIDMNLAAHPGMASLAVRSYSPIDQFKAILTALPQLGIMAACSLVITGYLGAVAQTDPIAVIEAGAALPSDILSGQTFDQRQLECK